MQRRYTGGARIFIYCCFFVCLLTAGAGVIQLTGMAEPSRSGRVSGVVRRPAVSGYIRCRYERPVATLESDALAQGVAGMRVSAVCLLRDRAGNWRVYGVYTTHSSGAESITIHHGRLQYRRLFPVFLTVVQTETVNTGVDMPGKPLQYTNSPYPD